MRQIEDSIDLIKDSGVEYEFRTTCVPTLVDEEDIREISMLVGSAGLFTLQQFQPVNTLDPDYSNVIPYSRDKLLDFLEIARGNTSRCRLIGLRQDY
jgi:pyruvate formate lyase activating enzyme